MKKRFFCLCILCAFFMATGAFAATENSFAIVNKNKVNLRRQPGGNRVEYLNEGQDVFVAQSKTYKGKLWHRVIISVEDGNACSQGWVDATFLTDVRDYYRDVVQADVGNRHVVLRFKDGSVDAFGFDFRENMAVEKFGQVDDIAASSFQSCGLKEGKVIYSYPDRWVHLEKHGNLRKLFSGAGASGSVLAVDTEGKLVLPYAMLNEAWGKNIKSMLPDDAHVKDAVYDSGYVAVLTEDGTLYVSVPEPQTQDAEALMQANGLKHVKQICGGFALYALMEDGTVQVFNGGMLADDVGQEVAGWKNVMDLTAAYGYAAAVMEDGSVQVAGQMVSVDMNYAHESRDIYQNPMKDGKMAHWENIVDVEAGSKILVGIRSDGGIEAVALFRYE